MRAFKMIVTDIVVKRFGGLLKKLKGIIRIAFMLALEVAKCVWLIQKEGLDETGLNTSKRNGCFTNY